MDNLDLDILQTWIDLLEKNSSEVLRTSCFDICCMTNDDLEDFLRDLENAKEFVRNNQKELTRQQEHADALTSGRGKKSNKNNLDPWIGNNT